MKKCIHQNLLLFIISLLRQMESSVMSGKLWHKNSHCCCRQLSDDGKNLKIKKLLN